MCSQTCGYVARKEDPEEWHGEKSSEFWLDRRPVRGGLGITEWHCPHPPHEDDELCIFHTKMDVSADQQQKELLKALDDAGDELWNNRPEHRGQFVGATFGPIDLSSETIDATDNHDIRFDHAQFRADDEDLNFAGTTFIAQGQHPISFVGAEFITDGDGDVGFRDATFRTDGDGNVWFPDATFRTTGDGSVLFDDVTFRTTSNVAFRGARFWTGDNGSVSFDDVTFRAKGKVAFDRATFRIDGNGLMAFPDTTFRVEGDGDVAFEDVTFRVEDDGYVSFWNATFRTDGTGQVLFKNATLTDANFQHVDFGEADLTEADLQGTKFTGADLRGTTVEDVSMTGATTCKRLYEGYGNACFVPPTDISSPVRSYTVRLRRIRGLFKRSRFHSGDWDAAARAYHDLKTVFSDHGLVGKARSMHIRERRARSLEAKAEHGWWNRRYLMSLLPRIFTGHGVQIWNLVLWMLVLFLFSTVVYVNMGVRTTLVANVFYSVLAFTVAPPPVEGLGVRTQIVVMVETFFGTLSIVLLGYILGNRERF